MTEPKIGTKLVKLGGYYKNHLTLVTYQGWTPEGYAKCWRVKDSKGVTSAYTPGPNFLFTEDGIDVFTGERTHNPIILEYVNSLNKKFI